MSQLPSTSGLIFLGNSGVGKSFLANILLDKEAFVHKCSPKSVTHETEFEEATFGHTNYAIFNIPGLFEADQEHIDRNKIEIYKAFQTRPNSVVAFIFSGGAGGRLLDQDLVAFKAIHEAYQFKPESLAFIVNDLPRTNRSESYEGETVVALEHLTKVKPAAYCFLDRLSDTTDKPQRHQTRVKLLDAITRCTPRVHEKHADIKLNTEIMKEELQKFKQAQKDFENQITDMKALIKEKDDMIKQQSNQRPIEIHHYHERVIERSSNNKGCIVC